jgi:hypothetical protein
MESDGWGSFQVTEEVSQEEKSRSSTISQAID